MKLLVSILLICAISCSCSSSKTDSELSTNRLPDYFGIQIISQTNLTFSLSKLDPPYIRILDEDIEIKQGIAKGVRLTYVEDVLYVSDCEMNSSVGVKLLNERSYFFRDGDGSFYVSIDKNKWWPVKLELISVSYSRPVTVKFRMTCPFFTGIYTISD